MNEPEGTEFRVSVDESRKEAGCTFYCGTVHQRIPGRPWAILWSTKLTGFPDTARETAQRWLDVYRRDGWNAATEAVG